MKRLVLVLALVSTGFVACGSQGFRPCTPKAKATYLDAVDGAFALALANPTLTPDQFAETAALGSRLHVQGEEIIPCQTRD